MKKGFARKVLIKNLNFEVFIHPDVSTFVLPCETSLASISIPDSYICIALNISLEILDIMTRKLSSTLPITWRTRRTNRNFRNCFSFVRKNLSLDPHRSQLINLISRLDGKKVCYWVKINSLIVHCSIFLVLYFKNFFLYQFTFPMG